MTESLPRPTPDRAQEAPGTGRAVARPRELRLAPVPEGQSQKTPQEGQNQESARQGRQVSEAPPRATLLERGSAVAWKQVRGQYTDFLPEQEAISGQRHSPLATLLLIVIGSFFLCFLIWAALAEVQQSVNASGQVRPDGRVKIVNHAEGGRVSEILVHEGQRVTTGEPLLYLDTELLQSENDRVTGAWQQVAALAARLEAEALDESQISFPAELERLRPDLTSLQLSQFANRRQALQNRRRQADNSIIQRQAEISSTQQLLSSQRSGLVILQEQAASLRELAGKGYFPWLRYQSVERDISDRLGEVARLEQGLNAARAALEEALAERQLVDQDWTNTVYDAFTAARAERDSLAEQRAQIAARLRDLTITATANGIVQDLRVVNIGQSVSPLEPLMSIVPVSERLIIEARVPNDDIGQVHLGQPARVKVRTYDFLKYGTLDGEVVRIAADSSTDERTGQIYYVTEVRTPKDHLGAQPGQQQVTPGMLVDVEMRTGKKSILAYLTDRILSTADSAFTEN